MNFIIKMIIGRLLKKSGRSKITTSGPGAEDNDDIWLYVTNLENETDSKFYIDKLTKNCIECLYKGEIHLSVPTRNLSLLKFEAKHFSKGWTITYDNIFELCLHEIFRVTSIRQWWQSRYDKDIVFFRDRLELLKLLIKLKKFHGKDFNFNSVLIEIYGPKINFSEQYYACYSDLMMLIRSFDESGDLKFNDDRNAILYSEIEILPKAYETVSGLEIERARHQDVIKISRLHLLVAILMFIVALVD